MFKSERSGFWGNTPEGREADDNVYKKGFVVDVNVQLVNGKPAAYRVTNVHQVIDLPSD
jgi:hypothetical protein